MITVFKNIQRKSYKKTQHFSAKLWTLLLSFFLGFSVFYILYFFEAYGIQKGVSYSGHTHFFRSVSFGVLTFVFWFLLEIWVKPRFNIKKQKDYVIWYVFLVLLGTQLTFLLFNFFWNWQEWNLTAYLLIVKEYPLMIAFPLTLYLVVKKSIKEIAIKDDYLSFQSSNGKDKLKIKVQDFFYANASENYITIVYVSNKTLQKHLIRKTLKLLEEELKVNSQIVRCHRSYIVNRNNVQNIKQIKGKVALEIGEASIPVSKQFHSSFLN
ncbi:LytR/AlgR family response regulator transcription factor [Tenacibaculum amylolyticum]|uniref:LytR/AlgR family response regulator transcription factor n=1 Tax=Tenacibaculum amylolyticum TaxID=104269 RepID=UPI003895BC58